MRRAGLRSRLGRTARSGCLGRLGCGRGRIPSACRGTTHTGVSPVGENSSNPGGAPSAAVEKLCGSSQEAAGRPACRVTCQEEHAAEAALWRSNAKAMGGSSTRHGRRGGEVECHRATWTTPRATQPPARRCAGCIAPPCCRSSTRRLLRLRPRAAAPGPGAALPWRPASVGGAETDTRSRST